MTTLPTPAALRARMDFRARAARWWRWLELAEARTDDSTCECGDPAVLVAHGYDGCPSPTLFCGPCGHTAGCFSHEANVHPAGPDPLTTPAPIVAP